MISGPGIKKDQLVFGTSLLDVAPTILQLYGLPVGEDMDGRVITEAFAEPPALDSIPSWDEVDGVDGCHSKDKRLDPAENEEALRQLVELGYIEELKEDKKENIKTCATRTQLQPGQVLHRCLQIRRCAAVVDGFILRIPKGISLRNPAGDVLQVHESCR